MKNFKVLNLKKKIKIKKKIFKITFEKTQNFIKNIF